MKRRTWVIELTVSEEAEDNNKYIINTKTELEDIVSVGFDEVGPVVDMSDLIVRTIQEEGGLPDDGF